MTEETGGRLIDVGNNGKKLEAAFQQIEDELRTQYVASYTPSNTKLDGSFRRLAVECRGDGMKVQVRKGYYALAPQNNYSSGVFLGDGPANRLKRRNIYTAGEETPIEAGCADAAPRPEMRPGRQSTWILSCFRTLNYLSSVSW